MLSSLKKRATYLLDLRRWCHNYAPSKLDLNPPTHVRFKFYNGRCLRYIAFECHANVQINWESFAHRNLQKERERKERPVRVLEYVALKLLRWRMSSFGLWFDPNVN